MRYVNAGSWIGNGKATSALAAFFAGEDVRHSDIDLLSLR